MREAEKRVNVRDIIENRNGKPIISLHLASYFRVHKDKIETERIFRLHGMEPVYDPARITAEINEEFWEDQSVDSNGFFTFLPKRLTLGHTLESINVPANVGLRMREFFGSEETRETFPLTTNWGAPLIHPGSAGPQTYEIINTSNQPLSVRVSKLICLLDVDYLSEPSVLTQQKLSKGQFGEQERGKIKLGNPGKDWEIQAIREALNLK
jgi:deoxycytidine triphosphate deaminase